MAFFIIFLMQRSFQPAKRFLSQLSDYWLVMSIDGFAYKDLGMLNFRDFTGLLFFSLGCGVIGFLVMQKLRRTLLG